MLKKQKYVTAVFCLFLSFFFAAMGILQYQMIRGKKPVSTDAGIEAMNNDTVLVGGMPIGIYMETDGVMVLNTEQIAGADGKEHEPAKGIVKAGDYIMAVDHCEITGKKELLEAVGNLTGTFVVLTVRRNGETIDLKIKPVEYETGEYRLGIWVRDNVQGLGTVTFLTDQSRFGALGHGIHDVDTSVLMSIAEGNVYRTSIRDITKGQSGSPGSMEGMIIYNNYNILGTIDKNTEAGIYGKIDKIDELFTEQTAIRTAKKEEIITGPATIRCFVDNEVREFDIEVTQVDMMSQEINKGLVIKVTDEELLEKNRRDYSGDERKSDHTKREIDRSSNPRFRTRLDKRLRNIHRKYVKTGEFTGNVWINVELLLQDSLDYAKWHRYDKRVAF